MHLYIYFIGINLYFVQKIKMDKIEVRSLSWTGKKIHGDNMRHDIANTLTWQRQVRLRPNALNKLYSPQYKFSEKDVNDMWMYVWKGINTFLELIVKLMEENSHLVWRNEVMSVINSVPREEFIHEWKINLELIKKYILWKSILQRYYKFNDVEFQKLTDCIGKYWSPCSMAKKAQFIWNLNATLHNYEEDDDPITKQELLKSIDWITPDLVNAQVRFLEKTTPNKYSWIDVFMKLVRDRHEIISAWLPVNQLDAWLSKADKWFEIMYLKKIKQMLISEEGGVDAVEVMTALNHIQENLDPSTDYAKKRNIKYNEWVAKLDPISVWNYVLLRINKYDLTRSEVFSVLNECNSVWELSDFIPDVPFTKKWQKIQNIKNVMWVAIKENMFNASSDENNAMMHAWNNRSEKRKWKK